jgi:hypothetical protein
MKFLLILCLLFTLRSSPTAGAGASPESGASIRIMVADARTHHAVKGARVFVLSVDGRELAASTTNDEGVTALSASLDRQHPKYVLVEHPHYFISGLTWLTGSREYYILTTLLAVS